MGEVRGWRVCWRIVSTRAWGFPGPATEVVDVDTVAQLREVVLRARADPAVAALRFWRLRQWVGGDPPHDCGGDGGYVPAGISSLDCRCGFVHRTYRCRRCSTGEAFPPMGPECGPLPRDPCG